MSVEHANPAFWAALAGFQGAVRGVGKDRKNPHLGNKYATLESVFDTIREPLAEHGLSVTQMSLVDAQRAGCCTVVAHAEGGYIECTLMLPIGEHKGISAAQAIGISLSYARRYALMGVLGLATADEDTDGGPPAGKGTPPKPTERPEPAPRRVAAPPPPKADPAPAPESPSAVPAPTTPAAAGSDGGTVIHYDPWWNPAVENQATDRAHRLGQDKPVFVYKLIIAGSIEEKILALQERKAELAAGILSEDSGVNLKFGEEDLSALFAPLPV